MLMKRAWASQSSHLLNVKGLRLLLKCFTAGVCLVGFVFNSFAVMHQYISGKTLLSSRLNESSSKTALLYPALVMCNKTAFANSKEMNTDLKDYLRNTAALEDILVDAVIEDSIHKNETSIWNQTKALYTAYHGNCFVLNPQNPVRVIWGLLILYIW